MQGERVRVINIMALGTRRGPATEAAELYEDMSPGTPSRRKDGETEQQFELREKGAGRPTKRARRETSRLKSGLV